MPCDLVRLESVSAAGGSRARHAVPVRSELVWLHLALRVDLVGNAGGEVVPAGLQFAEGFVDPREFVPDGVEGLLARVAAVVERRVEVWDVGLLGGGVGCGGRGEGMGG